LQNSSFLAACLFHLFFYKPVFLERIICKLCLFSLSHKAKYIFLLLVFIGLNFHTQRKAKPEQRPWRCDRVERQVVWFLNLTNEPPQPLFVNSYFYFRLFSHDYFAQKPGTCNIPYL
jgi:hypothetical protein